MKKQIDPNLDSSSSDLLAGISKEIDEARIDEETKKAAKTIDPQLNNDISSVIAVANTSNDNETNQDEHHNRSLYSDEHHHHSEHHHSEHHHSDHHHHHDDEEKKKKKKFLPIFLRILLVIFIFIMIIALVAGSTFLVLRHKGEKDIKSIHNLVREDENYHETIEHNGKNYVYDTDVIAFAFLGIDRDKKKLELDPSYTGLSDTDIVVAINTKSGKLDLIAIPRDTMVDVNIYNDNGQYVDSQNMQLCLAYQYGIDDAERSKNVTSAMSRILGVPIEKYFTLNLNGIGPLNDAIGGVELESKFDFSKEHGMDIKIGKSLKLEGEMAEVYVRARSSNDINASLNRTERQIQYLQAYGDKLLPAVKEDFSVISKLYSTAMEYSDTNITLDNVTYIASIMLANGMPNYKTHTLPGAMKQSATINEKNDIYAEYIIDKDAKTELILEVFYNEVG